jgi:serine/threonine-protein kinase
MPTPLHPSNMTLDLRLRVQRGLRGKFRIDRELGRGEMAVVYAGTPSDGGETVVIKLLLPSPDSPMPMHRFTREMALAQSLVHENIVPVLETGEADGLPYYVMPFFGDGSLRDRLTAGPLSIADSVCVATQVADALDYAHERAIVHRDIKPENILLQGMHAAVGDFGVGKTLDASHASITSTGFIVGTPTYMSPEQAANDGELDGRSDIYSLGVVLYEMIAGEAPFSGATTQQIIAARFVAPPPVLDALRPDVPRALAELTQSVLSLEPIERPTARDIASRLREIGAAT